MPERTYATRDSEVKSEEPQIRRFSRKLARSDREHLYCIRSCVDQFDAIFALLAHNEQQFGPNVIELQQVRNQRLQDLLVATDDNDSG